MLEEVMMFEAKVLESFYRFVMMTICEKILLMIEGMVIMMMVKRRKKIQMMKKFET
jgi:hypothetical protein